MEVPIKDHPYLFQVGPVFYFRRKVPLHLIEAVGRKEVKISLRTRDRREANRNIHAVAADIQCSFDRAEKGSEPPPQPSPRNSVPKTLKSITLEELEGCVRDRYFAKLSSLPGPFELAIPAMDRAEAVRDAEIELTNILEAPDQMYRGLSITAAKILEGLGVQVAWKQQRNEPDSSIFLNAEPGPVWKDQETEPRVLISLLYRAELELARQKVARLQGDFSGNSHDHLFNQGKGFSQIRAASQVEQKDFAKPLEPADKRPLTFRIEEWTNYIAQTMKPRQVSQYVSDLRALSSVIPLVSDVKLSSLQNFRETKLKGLSSSTIFRKISVYRSYWNYLKANELVSKSVDPFDGLLLPKKIPKIKRAAWSANEVCLLWREAKRLGNDTLADVIRIAAFTGSRIEAICSMSSADIFETEEAFFIRFSDKTKAGRRDVPIHSALQPLVRRLIAEAPERNGYLIRSTAENRHGERSSALGKQFGKLKTDLGYKQAYVFHNIRKTVVNLFVAANCLEVIVSDILGHEVKSMTYGVYRTGASLTEKKMWLEKALVYPDAEFMAG